MSADEERLGRLEETAASLLKKKGELNRQAERWKNERDRLNESVKSLLMMAHKEKEDRDQLNQGVGEIKKRIEALHREQDAKRVTLTQLDVELASGRRRLSPKHELEQDLRRIEWELSTTPTLEMQERETHLIDKARELRKALEEHKKLDAQEDKRLVSLADSKAIEIEVRRSRDEMNKLHEASQGHHEKMIQLYRKADEERKKADEAHNNYIDIALAIKDVNAELDKIMGEVREQSRRLREADRLVAMKRERTIEKRRRELADEAKRRLEAGEKLSLEELRFIYLEEEGETPNR